MANWYGTARSNYFRVKDKQKFTEWATSIDGLELIEDEEGRVGLGCNHDYSGGWPDLVYNQDTDDYEEIDVVKSVAAHLQEGSVAVFMEVGAEKMRYVTGWAVAVNHKGDTARVSLDDIYKQAAELGDEVTKAEY